MMSWFGYKHINKSTNHIFYGCRVQHYFLNTIFTPNSKLSDDPDYQYAICGSVYHIPNVETIIKTPLPHCKRCESLLKNNTAKITTLILKRGNT